MRPGWSTVMLPCLKSELRNPPISEPAIPSTAVPIHPIGWRSGKSARAMAPMMRPTTIHEYSPYTAR